MPDRPSRALVGAAAHASAECLHAKSFPRLARQIGCLSSRECAIQDWLSAPPPHGVVAMLCFSRCPVHHLDWQGLVAELMAQTCQY
mmetsp:Transcript_128455/g.320369  ORF Transcript_128455/g.320369 Transcript_128455/m.320369 type:complete len:86 (-) Transcript_128455:115-372(-)